MPQRLPNTRLIEQLQDRTVKHFYTDTATYFPQPDPEIGLDDYGQPPAESAGISIECSFNDKPKEETWGTSFDLQQMAGEIRFTAVVPSKGDQFTIQGRWDELGENPQGFEVVGIQDRGEMGWVCLLMEVQL